MKNILTIFLTVLVAAMFAVPSAQANAQTIGRQHQAGGWQSQTVAVVPGVRYVFTDQFKSGDTSEIDAIFTLSDSSTLTVRIGQFGATEKNKWMVADAYFTAPANATSVYFRHFITESPFITSHFLAAKNFNLSPE